MPVKTETRSPSSLAEAAIELPDGESFREWIARLEKAVIAAVSAILPPAVPDSRGRYPEQWVEMQDTWAGEALAKVCSYGAEHGMALSFWRVPWKAEGDGFTAEPPVQVEVEYKLSYADVGDGGEDLGEAAAYAAPFYAGEDGSYKDGGTFQATKSELLFRSDTAKLRNALAHFGQIDWKKFGNAADVVETKARKALDESARQILVSKKEEATANCIGVLLTDLWTEAIADAQRRLRARTPGAVELAESVLADVSGRHPIAGVLARELSTFRRTS
jgi:hypothetical protein